MQLYDLLKYKRAKSSVDDLENIVHVMEMAIEYLEPYMNNYNARTCVQQLKRHHKIVLTTLDRHLHTLDSKGMQTPS